MLSSVISKEPMAVSIGSFVRDPVTKVTGSRKNEGKLRRCGSKRSGNSMDEGSMRVS